MKKIFILAAIFILANFSLAQAENISAKLFFNGKVVEPFENDEFEITFGEFFKSTCKLRLKNNLEYDFKPRVRIILSENWGTKFEEKKNLPTIAPGKSLDFNIEMKKYSLAGRKRTSAWLQIWIEDKEKVLSENYFCVKFIFSDHLIDDREE